MNLGRILHQTLNQLVCLDYCLPVSIGSTSRISCQRLCLRRLSRMSTTVADVSPIPIIFIIISIRSRSRERTNYGSRLLTYNGNLLNKMAAGCSVIASHRVFACLFVVRLASKIISFRGFFRETIPGARHGNSTYFSFQVYCAIQHVISQLINKNKSM